MKILYLSQFYYPERAAGAFRAIDNSTIWSNQGHDVTLFTSYPNFPTGDIFKGYSNKLISEEKYKGIRVIRNKIIAMKNTNKINRAISSVSFLFYSLYNIFFNSNKIGKDYDVVLGTSGTILSPIIAYVFSRKNKIPFILELRDITYNQILAVYDGKKTGLYYFVKLIELYLCKKSDKIVVVTHGFKKILLRDGIEETKIEVIENGALISDRERAIYKKNNKRVTFSYIGNIGGSQNLNRVIDFFNNIEIKNIDKKLLIIGDGGKKEKVKEYISKNKIKDITVLDGMKYEELDKYYEESDFCIVSLNNNDKFKETIPSKIFTIMSKSRPILFLGPDGEASNIIKKANCGIIYNSKDYKEIARDISEKINLQVNDNKLDQYIKEYGESGYSFVNKYYNREKLAKEYISIMKNTVYERESEIQNLIGDLK